MGRTIDWCEKARNDLRRLAKKDSDRVRRAVLRLAVSEYGAVEQLKGFAAPLYRLRVGHWRVSIRYENEGVGLGTLSGERVLHRREAYRKSGLARQEIPGGDCFDETGE